MLQAAGLQFHKKFTLTHVSILWVALMVVFNAVWGIWYARNKMYTEHKQTMSFMTVWAANPGVLRLSMYMLQAANYDTCGMMSERGWNASITLINLILVVPPTWWIDMYKTKPFIVNIGAYIVHIIGVEIVATHILP